MYYIILDMEWNQALDRAHTVEKPVLLRGEIIQIGAVKCDEDFNLVKPENQRSAEVLQKNEPPR